MAPNALLLLFITTAIASTSEAVKFNCSGTATCQSLAGYEPVNSTTYGAILSLFQVPSLPSLLGANGLPLSTSASLPVAARSVVRIPFPCACAGGVGRSDRTPIYTVKPTDVGLDDIARNTFDLFVTFQEIAEANSIPNVNKINAGDKLWIPLPCSCDKVDGDDVVHLAHLVEAGSTIEAIAEQFGSSSATLLRLNGIGDPRTLQAGQAIDVPLKACSSSISSTATDSALRVSNGSYALTANDCVQCSCSSGSGYQLDCHLIQGFHKSSCPAAKCDGDSLGNNSTSGCENTICAYAGYTNATGSSADFTILTKTIKQPLCNSSHACRRASVGTWTWLIATVFAVLFGFVYLA